MKLDTPRARFAARASLVGVFASASALQVALPGLTGDDWLQVVLSGAVATMAYAGIGAATPIEPNVGKKA